MKIKSKKFMMITSSGALSEKKIDFVYKTYMSLIRKVERQHMLFLKQN
jgi:hypothetical protein